jgi:hypothetical protein
VAVNEKCGVGYLLIITDILQVLYAPHKAFKKVLANPKYLGVAIILLLFLAVQTGYYYSYYSKVSFEQTAPTADQLTAWTGANATAWATPATLTANNVDFINQTYFGNSSLQFDATNTNNLTASLNSFNFSVNCGQNGFRNLSMSIKLVSPQSVPQNASVTLYCANGTSDYFTYNLTPQLTSVDEWLNLTLPVGTSDWTGTGNTNWTDVTGMKLSFTYSSNSNVTVRLQGLFFHGQYLTVLESVGSLLFAASAIQSVLIQFLFQWIILTAIVFLILKALKTQNITWRTIFIAVGFVLLVLVIVSLINLVATTLLPMVYLPYDLPVSGSLIYPDAYVAAASPQSQTVYSAILAATSAFNAIGQFTTILLYVWEAALLTLVVRPLTGFPWGKSVAVAAGSVVIATVIFSILIAIGLV